MSFTNDDLKQLRDKLNGMYTDWELEGLIDALLARLEAAEAYAEFRLCFSSGHDGEKEKLEAWYKAAGK